MNNETIKTQANDVVARGKDLVAKGNQRQLVFRNKEGKSLFEISLTVAVGVSLLLLFTGFVSIPLLVIATGIAMFLGIKAEIRHSDNILDS
ncbi:MAG: hypothetical protein Phog2KO_21200 [Phototrophicaceae bacterium]